jgi:hypothetical protein
MSSGQGKEDDEAGEREDGDNKNATLGPGRSSAQNGSADGVSGEKMMLHHKSAVGDTV